MERQLLGDKGYFVSLTNVSFKTLQRLFTSIELHSVQTLVYITKKQHYQRFTPFHEVKGSNDRKVWVFWYWTSESWALLQKQSSLTAVLPAVGLLIAVCLDSWISNLGCRASLEGVPTRRDRILLTQCPMTRRLGCLLWSKSHGFRLYHPVEGPQANSPTWAKYCNNRVTA